MAETTRRVGLQTLSPASATSAGYVTAGAQTFGGAKTFADPISAPNVSGGNSGDVSIAPVGPVDSRGASISGQAIALAPADATHPGIVTIGAQTFAGSKAFSSAIRVMSALLAGPTVASIGATAATIYALATSSEAALLFVFGDDGSSGWADLVVALSGVAPKVLATTTMYGAPPTRTYSQSSSAVRLALSAGTQNVRVNALDRG